MRDAFDAHTPDRVAQQSHGFDVPEVSEVHWHTDEVRAVLARGFDRVGRRFREVSRAVAAAGFDVGGDPTEFWGRR